MYRVLVCTILLLFSVSTEAQKRKFSEEDITRAQSHEQKVALYDAVSAELARKSRGSRARKNKEIQTQLGKTLATEESQRIRNELSGSKLDSGLVPMNVLVKAFDDALPIRTWNPSAYSQLIEEMAEQRRATEEAIANNKAMQSEVGTTDWVKRVDVFREQRDLFGDDEVAESAYQNTYKDAQFQLKKAGDAALRAGDFGAAMSSFESLKQLNPDFEGIEDLIASAGVTAQARGFQDLLLEGDIAGAYRLFEKFSTVPMTSAQKREFMTPASLLADYFSDLAGSAVASGHYEQAYSSMTRESQIRNWLDMSSQISTSTTFSFTESMFELSVASSARDNIGLEYGYLLLAEEFDAGYPSLASLKRDTTQTLYENAIRRVGSVSLVSADSATQQVASKIAAGVRQYMMANVPDDVKIVERERLDAVKRERGMSLATDNVEQEMTQLESADFLIQGELLSAEVESVIKQTRNTERVVTGQEPVPNPDYEAWIKEKGRRKADHPDAPPKTAMRPIQEDITLTIEEHQKDGVVGVTYRIIDTENAEHIHSQSISKSMRVSDMASEGIRLGDYVKEARMAELPSDREIYNQLADQVIEDMAKDLVGFLANPDGDYFQNCKSLAAEGSYVEAADHCAKAAVLREYRLQDNSEIITELKRVTLNSGMRAN
jgi:tetratricopeptide (TPR) repeat protein